MSAVALYILEYDKSKKAAFNIAEESAQRMWNWFVLQVSDIFIFTSFRVRPTTVETHQPHRITWRIYK
jgi:hypothetical protein